MNTDKLYAESIAKEYAPKNNSQIVALRKPDVKAKMSAPVFAYTFGDSIGNSRHRTRHQGGGHS